MMDPLRYDLATEMNASEATPPPRLLQSILGLWRYALAVGVIVLLGVLVDFRAVTSALTNAHPSWLAAGFVAMLGAFVLTTWKWLLLLRSRGNKLRLRELIRLNLFAAFYASVLPGQLAGEAVKIARLARRSDSDRSTLLASVVVDRITSLIGLCLLGMLGMAMSHHRSLTGLVLLSSTIGVIVVVGTGVLVTTAFGAKRLEQHSGRRGQIARHARSLIDAVQSFNRPRIVLVASLLCGVGYQFGLTIGVWAFEHSLGLSVPLADLAWIFAVASVAQMLPVSVAGIGTREGAFIYLLGLQGVAAPTALAFSLLIFTTNLIMALLGGISELAGATKHPTDPPPPLVTRLEMST